MTFFNFYVHVCNNLLSDLSHREGSLQIPYIVIIIITIIVSLIIVIVSLYKTREKNQTVQTTEASLCSPLQAKSWLASC